MKKRLLSAMSDWEVDSCVIFTPHSTEEDYVSFEMGERYVRMYACMYECMLMKQLHATCKCEENSCA